MTIDLSGEDLEAMREALLFKMQRTPERQKGKRQWLRYNTAYDNLVDAINAARREMTHVKHEGNA